MIGNGDDRPPSDEPWADAGDPHRDDNGGDRGAGHVHGIDSAEIRGHEEAIPHEGEVDFEPDVEYLHRAIYREAFEPEEGRERVPWWVWTIFAIAIFWAGIYLGRYGGSFDTATHVALSRTRPVVRAEIAEETAAVQTDPIRAGQALYASRCQVCHQPDGSGVPGVFPPLIGAELVNGPPEAVVLVILHGLAGPVTVRGARYDGAMPGWQDILDDAEIAAVASYIRQWESNDASPVAPELVTALRNATAQRTNPWTIQELEAAVRSPEIRDAISGPGATPAPPPGGAP